MTYTIGIDVGGTFTDIVVSGDGGGTITAKSTTTPADQSDGVLEGIALAAQRLGLTTTDLLGRASRIVHGTTVATNALLEGKTAPAGMLTTAGHRDVIEMREGLKPDRYNLRMAPPPPLVPRRLRLPVTERVRADGTVEVPLDTASLDTAIDQLERGGVQTVAICFLHAWRNPGHEHQAAEAVRRRLPGAYVTTSFDVLPQIKEFERFSTTIANAAVGPVIQHYLGRLGSRLKEAGFAGELLVILSHGGVASVAEATRLAAGTALSGPAGGVAAAVALSRTGLAPDIIGFDMGGTSTDIAVVRGGQPGLSGDKSVATARIALPSLDIVTLGAGGGSIGHLDRSGLLAVGPQSAGADPGPACYGQGGQGATVTDANLVLGYLDAANFLGGRRRLDGDAATGVVAALAAELGIETTAAASGIHRLVNSRMADGVRVATVRRGVDPRGYTLLAFGGAAGLHVTAVAEALGIARVVVPLAASVLSAWGMLNTDLRIELSRSLGQTGGIDTAALQAAFAAMEDEGRARLAWFEGDVVLRPSADMRYGEQVFEIPVALDDVDWRSGTLAADIAERFHAAHERLYTYALRGQDVVVVNARLSAIGRLPAIAAAASVPSAAAAAPKGTRRIYLDGWVTVPVFDFPALGAGQAIAGPAIIESDTTTVLLRPDDTARMDPRGWLDMAISLPD
ncbi:hydantoinase/oxoprolinase family protein [Rhodopila globiformis]|uniref:5-oxoprolinase n=1 Tax=Rhodopila globiformis TaxID=1071 RepID=A0A2S6MXI5_RHOGL|nr:hydantoinase/oxoprolinase family protein [Rhodopila globiformis]PPQ27071.1 5-oxoprolinase [Rhodopila globiformis]